VVIDRYSPWVHLAVKDDELTGSAIAFLKKGIALPGQDHARAYRHKLLLYGRWFRRGRYISFK